MEGKKGFILYSDLLATVGQLPDDVAGRLFKYVLEYVNDKDPETDELLVKIAFEPIRQQLKRDLQKWDDIREKRSLAGMKSAEIRAQSKKKEQKATKLTSVKSVEQTSTKSTVNVNVNDNVNVNVINKKKPATRELFNLELKDLKLADKFQQWFDYRKEIKKSMKPSTVKSQINFLKKYTPEISIQIIDQSIRNGWTGLFDLKTNTSQHGTPQTAKSRIEVMSDNVRSANEKLNNMDL